MYVYAPISVSSACLISFVPLCMCLWICENLALAFMCVHCVLACMRERVNYRGGVTQVGVSEMYKCMPLHWVVHVCVLFLPQQVSLVVNVASECGFTEEHYRALQQLQRDLGPHHFNVLAFPCNQFGQQEPDSNKEIESFARRTYSVSFPMFSKVAVTGTGAHPAFKYLTRES